MLEYWVVDINGEHIFTYREPSEGISRAAREPPSGDTISPESLVAIQKATADLFA